MGRTSLKDRYQRLEKIGEGTCGVVFRCRDRDNGGIVAVKKVSFSYDGGGAGLFGVPAAVLREISVAKALGNHPNVVAIRDAFLEGERAFLVFEHVDCDLRRHMDQSGPLLPRRAKLYSWQLLRALTYCHAHRVVHRDVKPQNVLIKPENDLVKLCDFSLARRLVLPRQGAPQTRRVASLWYRSPEILLGKDACGVALDIWSVGCVIAEMLIHRPLFAGGSEWETLLFHFRLLGTPSEASWPGVSTLPHWSDRLPHFPTPSGGLMRVMVERDADAARLLRDLLRCCPERRPSAEHALGSCYFTDLDTTRHGAVLAMAAAEKDQNLIKNDVRTCLTSIEDVQGRSRVSGHNNTADGSSVGGGNVGSTDLDTSRQRPHAEDIGVHGGGDGSSARRQGGDKVLDGGRGGGRGRDVDGVQRGRSASRSRSRSGGRHGGGVVAIGAGAAAGVRGDVGGGPRGARGGCGGLLIKALTAKKRS
eukprot:TRINITY_DN69362_c0_g1_i1.p1 TRINITY_DN69362_c0_g1~~TRINITY_DN69362_c0_g1_i1.p1  ORF type:complete len:476 (+),score=72.70 TRINITY_DN69362_c0_g1_i1:37-1464(+)